MQTFTFVSVTSPSAFVCVCVCLSVCKKELQSVMSEREKERGIDRGI